jgi:predicted nucleotidyltransferase
MTNDALSTVSRFVASRYPTADSAILAGSRARGEESSGSDYDVVLLFESLPSGAWRWYIFCVEPPAPLTGRSPRDRRVYRWRAVGRVGWAEGARPVGRRGMLLAPLPFHLDLVTDRLLR